MGELHTGASLTAATVTAGAGAHLVVRQLQSDCCFMEGSVSYLVVRDATGDVVTWREFVGTGIGRPAVGLDVTIDPGSYSVDSFQRPCDANCGFLDPPTMQCSSHVSLRSGQDYQATVRWSVRDQHCRFSS